MAWRVMRWRGWWAGLALTTALACLLFFMAIPSTPMSATSSTGKPMWGANVSPQGISRWWEPIKVTLAARGPWLVALAFAAYSMQWIALVGFLPTIYQQAGYAGWVVGVLTALVSAGNIVGNVGAGRMLHAGVEPARLMTCGYLAMAAGSVLAFGDLGQGQAVRYLAVMMFSVVGGLIPATLFALAPHVAPNEQAMSATVGWMQQWSATGQFVGPPLVAWVAGRAAGRVRMDLRAHGRGDQIRQGGSDPDQRSVPRKAFRVRDLFDPHRRLSELKVRTRDFR